MTELRRSTAAGRARCIGPDGETCSAAIELCARLAGEGTLGGPVSFGPGSATPGSPTPGDATDAWIKSGALRGKSSLRHGLRRVFLRRQVPRVAEYGNLRWLAKHLFRVPRPLAAVSFWRRGLPVHQALLLELIPNALPLPTALSQTDFEERSDLLTELASEAARMHALGFAHRDFYLRNVLVLPRAGAPGRKGDPRRLLFIDAWSGGPLRGSRGAPRDLACMMLEGANLLVAEEQRRLIERYLEERAAQERPADRRRLLTRAEAERKKLLRRIAREPARWRLAEPPREWAWRDLLR